MDENFRDISAGIAKLRTLKRWALLLFPYLPFDPYAKKVHTPAAVSVTRLRINHYAVKSLAEYQAKELRWSNRKRRKRDDFYFVYHDRNDVYDAALKASVSQTAA